MDRIRWKKINCEIEIKEERMKRMKKRIFVLMITIALVFAVAGCGNSGKAEEKGDDPKPEVGQ